jgi:hypothetical protein
MVLKETYLDRVGDEFWEHVDRTGGQDACWEWQGPVHRQGHGTFPVQGIWSSPPAHRIAYHLTYGVPPHGQVIWRTCGNALCVNPRHLEAGDRSAFRRAVQARNGKAQRSSHDGP